MVIVAIAATSSRESCQKRFGSNAIRHYRQRQGESIDLNHDTTSPELLHHLERRMLPVLVLDPEIEPAAAIS
jgi:hypothetical protein